MGNCNPSLPCSHPKRPWTRILSFNQDVSKHHHKEKSKAMPLVNANQQKPMAFVSVNAKDKSGMYLRFPERNELTPDINETYVVDWFTRLI